MSYTDDCMSALTIALKKTDSLKYAIKELNGNADILCELVIAINRHNELMEMQLGLRPISENSDSINVNVRKRK